MPGMIGRGLGGVVSGGARVIYNGPPITPPPIGRIARGFGLAGGIAAAVWGAGQLGGNSLRDGSLAKMGYTYDPVTGLSKKAGNPNTGRRLSGATPPPANSTQAGVLYRVTGYINGILYYGGATYPADAPFEVTVVGPVGGLTYSWVVEGGGANVIGSLQAGDGARVIPSSIATLTQFKDMWQVSAEITDITRVDGQADPPAPPSEVFEPSGYDGLDGQSARSISGRKAPPPAFGAGVGIGIGRGNRQGDRRPGYAPPPNLDGTGFGADLGSRLSVGGRTGISNGSGSSNQAGPETRKVGFPPPDTKPTAPPPKPKTPDYRPELPPPKPERQEERRVPPPITPPPPLTPDLKNINDQLLGIGTTLGVIQANQAKIQADVDPVKMKQNTCEVLQSDPCTQKLKDDIRNPINQNIDANKVMSSAILGNQATQNAAIAGIATEQAVHKGMLASIITKLGDVFSKVGDVFNLVGKAFNNSVFDRAMQYIILITVMHNATMLTRSIGDTLGSALDQGLQVFGVQARMQDKDGVVTGVNAVIGKSFENLIKGIIGTENYTTLNETWAKANRVYQASINLVSNVQSVLDSTTAVAELSCNRVGILMNALRNSGMVREEAYGLQSQNVTKFNAFMNKLEALEQGTSNLAAITGNIVSTQQSVNEFKSNRQALEDALKNKDKGNGAPENTPEKEALEKKREETLFTIKDFSIVRPPEET